MSVVEELCRQFTYEELVGFLDRDDSPPPAPWTRKEIREAVTAQALQRLTAADAELSHLAKLATTAEARRMRELEDMARQMEDAIDMLNAQSALYEKLIDERGGQFVVANGGKERTSE